MRKAMEELNADLELRNAQIQTLQKQITEAENSDANGGHHVAAGTGGSSKVGNVTYVIVSTFMRDIHLPNTNDGTIFHERWRFLFFKFLFRIQEKFKSLLISFYLLRSAILFINDFRNFGMTECYN